MLSLVGMAQVTVWNLRTENLENPLGIDTATPRLSWMSQSDKNNTIQTSYHIIVASSEEKAQRYEGDLWDSGEVQSTEQLWIPYAGKTLKSNQRAWWRVRINTNKGRSAWSEIANFGIGLLSESQWGSRWIGLERLMLDEATGLHTRLAARYLRKEFTIKKEVKRATVYISGLGLYELYINAQRIGNQVLAPVPTDYRRSVMYNAYDVTDALHKDANAIGVILGNGRMFPMRQNKPYKAPVFGFPKCRFEMIVEYADGSTEKVRSDESWKVTTEGPIRANNEYDGEIYDARMELGAWTQVGYDDSQWLMAERTDIPTGELHGQMTPNMTIIEELHPKNITTHNGKIIVDFGQNMAGWVTMRIRGAEGDTIHLRFAEKLNAEGGLYTANLRDAQCEDLYICNGGENGATWHPTFVYHGFRYVEAPAGYTAADFTAQVISDQMEVSGHFTCSDTILTQIHHNALWGIRSNYKGMPIDCPQRNERQPWLGDRTAGSLGESYVFDNERLYSKWMRDICESQRADGCIPDVAPAFWNYYSDDVTWPAALPFTCEMLWEQYGNIQPIRNCYPYIKKWVNHIINEYSHDGIVGHDKYGDWCVPPERLELIHSQDPDRITDGDLLSTAYVIRVMQLMSKFASLLDMDDSFQWDEKARQMTEVFNKMFLVCKPNTSKVPGHPLYPDSIYYGNNTPTANLLPLAFGMVEPQYRNEVMKNIVTNIITKNNGTVSCGVIGISWLLRTLSENGYSDLAYLLATNTKYPSWGYMVENGATTIWELWNGDKADPAMNSANHVMLLGDLMTWCYEYIGGIRPGAPGYSVIQLKPDFTIDDNFGADVSHITPYGKVSSCYTKTLEHVDWMVEIPCNTKADVYMPDGTVKQIGSGKYKFSVDIPTASPSILDDEFI
ncbi:MAG: family 78 glycoside hydrolase catalytic domain, partial [Prevotella sp.]|nr:family 78 glycoside hydrolase catalytic domain [Prevotella sp.]